MSNKIVGMDGRPVGVPPQGQPQGQGPPRQQIQVNAEDLPDFKCTCGSIIWEGAIKFKKISRVISNDGRDSIQPIQVFICKKCGKDLSESLDQMKK